MPKTINIIGAGIAGLSAGCYLQMKGFETRIFESHNLPGGLCTSWKRGDYTIDGCIHWLVGSGPGDPFHKLWNELVDLDRLTIVDAPEFFRISDASGKEIVAYTDIDRLEKELLEKAPEDRKLIMEFTRAVRKVSRLKMPVEKAPEIYNLLDRLKMMWTFLPYLGILGKYGKILTSEFIGRCKNPLLAKMFESAFIPEMPFLFLIMTFTWLNRKSAGYPVGGSLQFSRLIEKKYLELGGEIHYGCRVKSILTEDTGLGRRAEGVEHRAEGGGRRAKGIGLRAKGGGRRAKGVELENGEVVVADITVSAADGHATIFGMLEGRFVDDRIRHYYTDFKTFPSYVQVSLGVARRFEGIPPVAGYPLATPFELDPEEKTTDFSYRIMSYDPTMAPAGKTVIIVMLKTNNYQYWADLRENDREKYKAEKQRIADFAIEQLEAKFGGISENLEMVDVATPATVIRYTNNWKGSFEGWLMTRETGFQSLPKTLPGLSDFYMAGHWVEPGGGLPAALLSGRNVSQVIERKYR